MNKDITVVVGMSGGVDSSVAAYLLKEKGYNVVGVTMELWQAEATDDAQKGGCCATSAVDDARKVCEILGIPYYVKNYKDEFNDEVVKYFVDSYKQGITPNPCIMCNRKVKWEMLLTKSSELNADYIATGHYASIVKQPNGRYALKKSKTIEKDQTYALYRLTQEQLSRTMMPVGDYSKDQIREIAKKINITIANKPDSQDICFIEDGDYIKFLEDYTGEKGEKGNFVDIYGNVLGEHQGITNYTIGQRKGLGISLGKRKFVVDIIPETNEVVLGENEDTFGRGLKAENINLMAYEKIKGVMRFSAKIRYNHRPAMCSVRQDGDTLVVEFDQLQRAITKGQSVVLYDEDLVVGGGIITKIMK